MENGNDDEPLLHVRAGHHTFSPGDECQNLAHALLSSVHLLPIRGGKGGVLGGGTMNKIVVLEMLITMQASEFSP